MEVTKLIGVGIFLAGIIVLSGFSIYPVYITDVEDTTILLGIRIGMGMLITGAALLIVVLCVERYGEYKETREKITEEDLRP